MNFKQGQLVYYNYASATDYGVISRIDVDNRIWSYWSEVGGKGNEYNCGKEPLSLLGPECLGVWNEDSLC